MDSPQTGFDRWVNDQMKVPSFACEFERARVEIENIDKSTNAAKTEQDSRFNRDRGAV